MRETYSYETKYHGYRVKKCKAVPIRESKLAFKLCVSIKKMLCEIIIHAFMLLQVHITRMEKIKTQPRAILTLRR